MLHNLICCGYLLVVSWPSVIGQTYQVVDEKSSVKFVIRNFGINVDGSFGKMEGLISFNPTNLGSTSIKVSVNAATVNTSNNSRDDHLRKEEYFDVKKHPRLIFISEKIERDAAFGSYLITGSFTIKQKSKAVKFPFTVIAKDDGYLFNGKINVNRRDFDVGGSSFVMSDNVLINISVFARKN